MLALLDGLCLVSSKCSVTSAFMGNTARVVLNVLRFSAGVSPTFWITIVPLTVIGLMLVNSTVVLSLRPTHGLIERRLCFAWFSAGLPRSAAHINGFNPFNVPQCLLSVALMGLDGLDWL